MSIKLALLKSGEQVISDIKELVSNDKVCGYLFKNPQAVITQPLSFSLSESEDFNENSVEMKMSPWILLSMDDEIPVPPDYIVTIVEPVEEVVEMYKEKTNGTSD
jgi:hypothetical protein